jgi:hypothetical protein
LKKHTPWFEKGCPKLLVQREQDKLQWLPDPSNINGDNLNNIRRKTSRHFTNKQRKYLKENIDELATNSKLKNIRDLCTGINDCKRDYQPRSNLVKNENGYQIAESHNILNRRKKFFSQLLNVHGVSDVRQIEIHRIEQLVADPSPFEFEIFIQNLKGYEPPCSNKFPAELIQAGGEIFRSKIHKLINSIWNKEKFPSQWKESIIVPVHKKSNKTDCNYRGILPLSTSYSNGFGQRVTRQQVCK